MSATLVNSFALVQYEILPELNRLLIVLDAEHNTMLVELLTHPVVSLIPRVLNIVIHQANCDV